MARWVAVLVVFLVLSTFIQEEADAVILGVAVGGLVTGTLGIVLSAIALGAQVAGILAAKEKKEEMMMMMMMDDDGSGEMMETMAQQRIYHDYHHSTYKRSAEDVKETIRKEKSGLEEFIDKSYERDQSQCVEMLVCDVTRSSMRGINITSVEEGILKWIEEDVNHGATYKRMVMAQKVAIGGGDCEFLFDSCPLKTSQMVEFMDQATKNISYPQILDNKDH